MDEAVRIAILGAGNVRCSPDVVASLATYFGERPLELRLYDADEERLDLFDRFARHCFMANKAPHTVLYRPEPFEALEDADRVLLQVDVNCAAKLLGQKSTSPGKDLDLLNKALARLLKDVSSGIEALSLQTADVKVPLGLYRRTDWPSEPGDEDVKWMPHQILRWIRGDEPIYEILERNERSPLKAWLDDPNSAELVINRDAERPDAV